MYSVLVKLPDGCFLSVTTHDELHEAVQFATELNANWPQKYVVRDSQGNAVHVVAQCGDPR